MRHPSEFGFVVGASFDVAAGKVQNLDVKPTARSERRVVYVAWMEPINRALKVGMTSGTLWSRWSGIVRVMNAEKGVQKLKPNEWHDQLRLLGPAAGQHVSLWLKPAGTSSLDYTTAEGFPSLSLAEGEERFLDWYYHPAFGKPLGPRRPLGVG